MTVHAYTIVRKERASIQLTVTPDMVIVVTCPKRLSVEDIDAFVKRKRLWVGKQVAFFRKYKKRVYQKEYVSGESFFYLGRQYQLIVRKAVKDSVILSHGKLIVASSLGGAHKMHIKKLVEIWYKERAREIFPECFDEVYKKFLYKKDILLRVAVMSKKWGSFRNNIVTLNPRLMQASKDAIEYVITHELCHVKYKNHDKKFWKLLDEKCPGWEKVKEKLEVKFG